MKKSHLLALATLALFACGDDKVKPDAAVHHDAPNPDSPVTPAPPTPGAQIDRMGRPAINTALNHAFDAACTSTTCPAKDAYNQDGSAGLWTTTYLAEFTGNLPFFDFLDTGLTCTLGACTVAATQSGCGNQLLYNYATSGIAGGGTPVTCPGAGCSYNTFATVAADDQLYVDTSKTTCTLYLAVELGAVAPALAIADCGGRTLTEDVIDVTYTAVSTGLSGFTATFDPAVKDGAVAHTDVTTTFPFLGAPHSPN